ncbi:MAG: AtpZ/AtpI family protein [Candidatus Margulisbacteria bacterium]|nr:AtpZ/AtpI family protein [Candidatus Margulisiibacteriota bacterium]
MEKDKKDKRNSGEIGRSMTVAYQIGFTLVGSVALFYFIGKWLDNFFHLHNIFMIGGVIFGAVGGFYVVYKIIMDMDSK